jgi:hypothetical protein
VEIFDGFIGFIANYWDRNYLAMRWVDEQFYIERLPMILRK